VSEISILAIDLAKNSFQVCGAKVDRIDHPRLRHRQLAFVQTKRGALSYSTAYGMQSVNRAGRPAR
jgi:hypothetical protein